MTNKEGIESDNIIIDDSIFEDIRTEVSRQEMDNSKTHSKTDKDMRKIIEKIIETYVGNHV